MYHVNKIENVRVGVAYSTKLYNPMLFPTLLIADNSMLDCLKWFFLY